MGSLGVFKDAFETRKSLARLPQTHWNSLASGQLLSKENQTMDRRLQRKRTEMQTNCLEVK
jgi:hypothetical protein